MEYKPKPTMTAPWYVDEEGDVRRVKDDWLIAELSDEMGPIYRVRGEMRNKSTPVKSIAIMRAHGQLIAAAPDLLEALEGLYQYCFNAGDICDEAKRARDAIAKAKGQ